MAEIKSTLNNISILGLLTLFFACYGQNKPSNSYQNTATKSINIGQTVSSLGQNIDFIWQDQKGNYWFASNGQGVYYYDGKTLKNITQQQGLCSNYVLDIQEDIEGHLWFSTREGVCMFDGKSFVDYTEKVSHATTGKWRYTPQGIILRHLNGLCYYDGMSFMGFSIDPKVDDYAKTDMNRPYSVYSTLVDNNANVWFGTQEKGVCRYDGNSYTFYNEQGLDKAAVRTLFQDKTGTIWAGNNGAGLFKFDGKGFHNFTDEKKLANPEFLKTLKAKEGTLARPWSINEDNNGNLWIGTIDSGLWKYRDGVLTNYTQKDGLTGQSVWKIFKDKKGELWFVVDGNSICKFNGKTFEKYNF